MGNLQTGLLVTALGMALVFLALIIVMVVILVLDRVFRPGAEDEERERAPLAASAASPLTAGATGGDPIGEAAAIAVAIALQRRRDAGSLYHDDIVVEVVTVTTIDPGHGIWRGYGRMRAMS